nr:putative ribonuclease H-like domain-containing protein [Tanacetum cinerariifolium]
MMVNQKLFMKKKAKLADRNMYQRLKSYDDRTMNNQLLLVVSVIKVNPTDGNGARNFRDRIYHRHLRFSTPSPFPPPSPSGNDFTSPSPFEGSSDSKEHRIIDLKFEYQTFRAKPSESLSQTYTRYKTLLNELSNDGVTMSKHDDEVEESDDKEMTQVKVLMAPSDDELGVEKNHAHNGEWIDITMRKRHIREPIWMVENQNDVKVKQIRNDNEAEFRNSELESFCDDKGISHNFSSDYTHEQNGVAEKKNKTLIEAAEIMLNGLDHLDKFDAKADDGYFLRYLFVSKAFRVFNIRRQQIEETYHITFDEIPEATQSQITHHASTSSHSAPQDRWLRDQHIKLVNINGLRMVENQNDVKVKQIRNDNEAEFRNSKLESFCDDKGISHNFSSDYTPEQNGVAKRKNRTLIEAAETMLNGLVLSKHFWTEEVKISCYIQNRSIIDHLDKFDAKADDGYFLGYLFVSKAFRVFNTRRQQIEETYHITFDEIPEATQSQITHHASTSSHSAPQDRWLRDQHIKLVNINGKPIEGMLIRSMASKLTHALVSECPFADFLFKIEPKKDYNEISNCQEKYTRDLLKAYEISDSSLVKTPMVPQDNLELMEESEDDVYEARDEMDEDIYHTDVEETQSPSPNKEQSDSSHTHETIESDSDSSCPDVLKRYDNAPNGYSGKRKMNMELLPRTKKDWLLKVIVRKKKLTMMRPLHHDPGEGMLRRSMDAKLTAASASECLFADFLYKIEPKKVSEALKRPGWVDANPKESHLIVVKIIFRYLKRTPSFGLWYPKCSRFNVKGYSYSNYTSCNIDRKITLGTCQLLRGKLDCWGAKKQQLVAMSSAETDVIPNYLKEFWCTALVVDLNPPTNESQARPFKELSIKFTMKNGTKIDIREIIYNDLVARLMPKSRTLPPVPSQSNFSKYPSEVNPIELTAFMAKVINREKLVSPLPASEKIGKKNTQNVTKPKPKSQVFEASRVPPQKGKNIKTKKFTLVQTTIQLTKEKVPSGDTNTSQSVSTGQSTDPQDTEGNKQPAVKDTAGNKQPTVKGFPATHPDEGTRKTKYLLKRTNINPIDSGRHIQLTNEVQPLTLVTDQLGDGIQDQVDKTQSTGFEMSDLNKKGKTSSEVDSDTEPMLLQTFCDLQALLDSEDE